MISLLACSLEVAAAGVLTARKQFTFLVGAMMLTLGLVAVYCTAVRTYNWGLTGVWWGEWQSPFQEWTPHLLIVALIKCQYFTAVL